MPQTSVIDWSERCRDALLGYSEALLRAVGDKLVRPRSKLPVEELIEKSVAMVTNAPVIDRRIKEQPPAARKVLAFMGLSRQPRWKVGHLLTLLAALDHNDGFTPVQALLETALLFPERGADEPPVEDFAAWFGLAGTHNAVVFAHPGVALRARAENLELPDLTNPDDEVGTPRQADGLEWPLRLAAAWQQVQNEPVRLTQGHTLFKRDLLRLQGDAVLAAPPVDQIAPVADAGVLALLWARAVELLAERGGALEADPFPATWEGPLLPLLGQLMRALPLVEPWDPLTGYAPTENGLSPTPTAGLLSLLLARDFVHPDAIAEWLWSHHPSWAGVLPAEAASDKGAAWVRGYLLGVAYSLGIVEVSGELVRLSALGRHLLFGDPEPPAPPTFPQTLMVQPNAEILAYRQGLTPALVASLTRFAAWKGIGPACTLELTPEQTYRGLESGLTLPMIVQTLNRHGTRPVPAGVADLLQRWASKRERITAFASAVLVEFQTPAELDIAVARGVVVLRLTDRIGMTADGREPSLSNLRLIGNRDYESKPQRCLAPADDGVTLTVDGPQADLLLEAELKQFAEPLPIEQNGVQRFRLTPASLRKAVEGGRTLAELDAWFLERSGSPLSAAGRLLLLGSQLSQPRAERLLVVKLPTVEIADGLVQWPGTRALVAERLGPLAVSVAEDQLAAFREALKEIGVRVDGVG
ncbi:helicase-associated domain-containing protein [Gemmata sp. JC717]|uniref:helicase-associated domain-containing protein n=1 Tax=Gemmata algarum TaxID=2975278 RepID=UPI0021BA4D9B|nr:helicase-associated domain-containing protein [Gemmata algarum]MDY3555102.1 helicase-associated domain-containing protein [Gemmata algarum]